MKPPYHSSGLYSFRSAWFYIRGQKCIFFANKSPVLPQNICSLRVCLIILFVWCNQFRVRVVIVCMPVCMPVCMSIYCQFYLSALLPKAPGWFHVICSNKVTTKKEARRLSICLPRRSAVIISHKCCVQMRLYTTWFHTLELL